MFTTGQQPDAGSSASRLRSVKLALQGLAYLLKKPIYVIDNLFANRKSQVVSTFGIDSINPDFPTLIYVHHSKTGVLTEREVKSLDKVRNAGFQVCLVINVEKSQSSQSRDIESSDATLVDAKIIRMNFGWDLSAYRDAYFLLKNNAKIKNMPVIFMNNSVIWFPELIENYFRQLVKEDTDIIASSISKQYRPHIQTFLFGALNQHGTEQIELWLKTIKNWRLKKTVVSKGELATNQILKSSALSRSYPDYSLLQETALRKIHDDFTSRDLITPYVVVERLLINRRFMHAGVPINPSHNYWLELIENGFPGIKIDLVKNNPSGIPDYEVVVSSLLESGFDYQMISELLSSNKSKSLTYKIRTYLR